MADRRLLRTLACFSLSCRTTALLLHQIDGNSSDWSGPHGPVHLQVSSFGVVGTRAMIEELGSVAKWDLRMNAPADTDNRTHVTYERLLQNPKLFDASADVRRRKILYVYSDPVDNVVEIYRRNLALEHASKTRTTAVPEPFPETLDAYAAVRHEAFEILWHVKSFLHQCDYPIAFLRLEAKSQHLEELARFLEVSPQRLEYHIKQVELTHAAKEQDVKVKLTRAAEEDVSRAPPRDVVPAWLQRLIDHKLEAERVFFSQLQDFEVFKPKDCMERKSRWP